MSLSSFIYNVNSSAIMMTYLIISFSLGFFWITGDDSLVYGVPADEGVGGDAILNGATTVWFTR